MNGTALRKPTARRVVGVVAGIVIIALGIALFKQSHLGNDSISALLCWLLGGLVGLGTLICAFCLGPFIQFFDRTFSQKVLQYKPNN